MQKQDIDIAKLYDELKKCVDGDMKNVMEVLKDVKKSIEFAVEFAGQPIYINHDIPRKLKYIELVIEYEGMKKDYGVKQAIRRVARMYNYTPYWVKKILRNHNIDIEVDRNVG